MDGAPTAASFAALQLAATSATFQLPSGELTARYGSDGVRQLALGLPFPILDVVGALPIYEDGNVVGAIGVAGIEPERCGHLVRDTRWPRWRER
jgi:uncharacterized protein GlcG (DUF336 family)